METSQLKEYWKDFPEAPYSDTFKWVDADGYEHMMTVRGWEGGAMLNAVSRAKEFIANMGGKPAGNRAPVAPAPEPDPAAKIALEEGNKQMAAELQAEAVAVPPAQDGKQWNVTNIVFVKILPQPDNRVTIEFYGDDHVKPHNKYADLLVNKWTVERASGLMKHVTSAPVTTPAEFSLNCKVYWIEGKEKTNGGHFKDVYYVR